MKTLLIAIFLIIGASGRSAFAHEFWLEPDQFHTTSNVPREFRLYVGQFYEGESIPFSKEYVASFKHYSAENKEDLTLALPSASNTGFAWTLQQAGAHVLAVDTHPNTVTLSDDQFHSYLQDEGLDQIIALRKLTGNAKAPVRERYRRHIKTIVTVDGKRGDAVQQRTAQQSTGQRLEIVPLTDLQTWNGKNELAFQLLFDNQPLAGSLIKAWHRQNGQITLIRARSGNNGDVQLTLPFSGVWMLSVVHMLPMTSNSEFSWESFWGNLTFSVQ